MAADAAAAVAASTSTIARSSVADKSPRGESGAIAAVPVVSAPATAAAKVARKGNTQKGYEADEGKLKKKVDISLQIQHKRDISGLSEMSRIIYKIAGRKFIKLFAL